MAQSNTDISLPLVGMVDDLNPDNKDSKQYSYALNASVEDFDGNGFPMLQNHQSNILAVNFPKNFEVIGKMPVPEQNRTLYIMIDQTSGISQIGEVLGCQYDDETTDQPVNYECGGCILPMDNVNTPWEKQTPTPYCSYRTIVDTSCANFSIDYPVDMEYRITDCGLNIYFTDGLNQRRYMYFNYLNDDPRDGLVIQDHFRNIVSFTSGACVQPVYGNTIDCNKINYEPTFTDPCLELVDVVSAGSLRAGVYQAIIAYADSNGNALTQYFPATNPISIFTRPITVETNYLTDKAIHFNINNLDTTGLYSYYNIVIAATVDNFTQFRLAGTFPVSRTSFTYTGDNPTEPILTPNDIFFQRPFYNTARGITSANNYLFFTGLEEWPQPNLQRVALDIVCYWETVAIPEPVYNDPKNINRFRSFMRDEVYPLGIIFEFNEGDETCALHIPGPSAAYFQSQYAINVNSIVSNNDVLPDNSCANLSRNKLWQVYNIAQVIGTPHEFTPTCIDNGCWEWGDFSYWESIETYPNNPIIWGNLCGEPIRYHKFPDSCVTHIHDSLNGAKMYGDKNIVYPIGIRVDHNSVITALNNAVTNGIITQADRNRIKGYRIVRGNRVGHKSIVAKGLLYDMWSYSKFNRNYYYANYPYNDLRNDNFISNDPSTYSGSNDSPPIPNVFAKTSRYTFHSPDIHFVNPSIGTDLKLETLEYGTSEGYFNHCEEQAKYKLLSTASMTVAFAAGVAAALSATTEKSCTTYTQTATYKETQESNGNIASATFDTGQNITGSGTTTITTVNAGGSIGAHDISLGERDTSHNNTVFTPYDSTTGQPIGTPVNVSSTTQTTCTGTTYQLLSPLSGSSIGFLLQQAIYQAMLGLKEMQTFIDLLNSMIPFKNLAIQYNSVGRYNNYQCVPNNTGNKYRHILNSAYLSPEIQIVDDSSDLAPSGTIYINNWNRESSVYVRIDNSIPFPNPAVQDQSRRTMNDFGLHYSDLNVRVQAPISSYYASIKNFVPDQYGDVFNIEYLETSACAFDINGTYGPCTHVFGGDTFISRFGLKIKVPFFIQTAFRLNNEADIIYSDLGNIGYPNYYFNSPQSLLEKIDGSTFGGDLLSIIEAILGVPQSRLDAKTLKVFYQNGYIHLYNYGIPYFLVESDVDVDLRYGQDTFAKDFYPHQQDLDFWFQEKNVPITEDNYYFYNTTYSKQNKESEVCVNQPDFQPGRECKVAFPNRIIYSDQVVNYKQFDNWLVFKANNFFDFPLSNGTLISADGIENDKVLVRFENTSQVFSAYDTLQTGNQTTDLQIGTGGLFASRPKEFASTTLGYAGTQHRDLVQSEFGHVWVDAPRGQIFNLLPSAEGLDEISKNGKKNWFKENLPFQIFKDFPTLDIRDIDNNFKGIGITMSFDKRFNRFYLTKLDYKVIDPKIQYDPVLKQFFFRDPNTLVKTVVTPQDTRYFCNKSWTISYNFFTKSWVSYHTFKDQFLHNPNFYVDHIDHIESGYNNPHQATLWSHNLTNKSYQVFGGNLYPFIVETQSGPGIEQKFLTSVGYTLDVLRYQNEFDWAYINNVTFNKAIVYNQRQCSGLLELVIRDENDLSQIGEYPNVTDNKIEILVTNSENKWNFNDFYDTTISQSNNLPIFLNDCSNAFKKLNAKALDYFKPDLNKSRFRSEYCTVRLINDKYSSYKFIFKFTDADQKSSIR